MRENYYIGGMKKSFKEINEIKISGEPKTILKY